MAQRIGVDDGDRRKRAAPSRAGTADVDVRRASQGFDALAEGFKIYFDE